MEKELHKTTVIDGKKIAAQIKEEIAEEVKKLKSKLGRPPHLVAVIVGDDPASHTYVNGKVKACKLVGFDSTLLKFNLDISEKKILEEVERLNNDDSVDGFIVQLPLPEHVSATKVNELINPEKDVDGFTNENFGRITADNIGLLPATPYGIIELIKRYNIQTRGKHAVLVGNSRIVGEPLSLLLSGPGKATVTICHVYTEDLAKYTRQADILIVVVGKPGLITGNMVKEGVVIIDVGITRVIDSSKKRGFTLKGDVDYDSVAPKSSYITPVPGGVGPMTIAALLLNTLKAARNRVS